MTHGTYYAIMAGHCVDPLPPPNVNVGVCVKCGTLHILGGPWVFHTGVLDLWS